MSKTFNGAKFGSFLLSSVFCHLANISLQPPPAGINPTIVSTKPITIFVCDATKLLCTRTSKPPPKVKPEGADITGYFEYLSSLHVSWKYLINFSIDLKSPLFAKSIV